MTTPETLQRIGEALYGLAWRAPLARDLSVTERTIRRWATGAYPLPDTIGEDLVRILADRRDTIEKLEKELTATPPVASRRA